MKTTDQEHQRLTKHHGLGNDFLIALVPGGNGADLSRHLDSPRPPGAAEATAWCDRRTGIGADGLIVATPEPGTDARRWRMVLWNSDGGRAEISGNGIRCLAQAIVERLDLDRSVDQSLTVETDAGARPLTVRAAAADTAANLATIRAGMGKALPGPELSRRWSEVGVDVISQVGVDLGNPHLVAFVDSLQSVDMAKIGPVIEADYPAGLNVHLVAVDDPDRISLRVWERGAGVTRACGSGACAAAWAAHNAGLVGPLVTVRMPGGSVEVELTDDEVFLSGPAVAVAEVSLRG